jgi:dynein light chain roadblock-type
MSVNEADETFKRLSSYPGVHGVIIMNSEGIPIRSSLNHTLTISYVSLIHGFSTKAKAVIKEMDHQNEVTFIRLRSNKDEILIAPDKEFTMIVIQSPIVGSTTARGMFFTQKDK